MVCSQEALRTYVLSKCQSSRYLHLEIGYEQQGWTRTHAFFALMGGFALYESKECVSVLRFVPGEVSEEAKEYILNSFRNPNLGTHAPTDRTSSINDDIADMDSNSAHPAGVDIRVDTAPT